MLSVLILYFKRIHLNCTHVSTYSHVGPYKKMHNKHLSPAEADKFYLMRKYAYKLNGKHMYQ